MTITRAASAHCTIYAHAPAGTSPWISGVVTALPAGDFEVAQYLDRVNGLHEQFGATVQDVCERFTAGDLTKWDRLPGGLFEIAIVGLTHG